MAVAIASLLIATPASAANETVGAWQAQPEQAQTQGPTPQALQPSAAAANRTFAVVVGESRILQVNELVRVAVADPSVADVVVVSKTEVIVNGKKEGRTTLHVWDAAGRSSYNVRVCVDNADLIREIEETIGMSGVTARFARSTLLLDGFVETDGDSQRAERIAKAYADKVVNLLTVRRPALPPPPPAVDAEEVESAIGVQGVSVRVIKDTVILEGQVESALDAERAEKISRIFTANVLSFVSVSQPLPPSATGASEEDREPVAADQAAPQVEGSASAGEAGGASDERDVKDGAEKGPVQSAEGSAGASGPAAPEPSAGSEEIDPDAALRDIVAAAVRDPAVEITVVKGTVLLEGLVQSEYAKLRAETVARLYSPKVVSIIRVEEAAPAQAAPAHQAPKAQQEPQQPETPAPAPVPAPVPAPAPAPGPASEVATGPQAQKIAEQEPRLEDRVSEYIGVPTVRVRSVDGKLLLEGSVASQNELERVNKIAGMFSRDVVNLVEMTDPAQVLLQVNVVEVNRGSLKNLGVTWGGVNGERIEPGSFLFGEVSFPPLPPLPGDLETWEAWRSLIPKGSPVAEIWRLSPIRAVLDLLVSQDVAEVLAAPSLLTLSGKQADFLVGGEIPVYVGQSDGKIVFEWRPYGIKLTMLPTVDARGRIVIDVQPEVSSLDWNNALDVGEAVVPALKVRRASTHLVVEDGATIAIGGLLQSADVKVAKKVPLLGDIPIIGSLFKSEEFQRGETELVILITTKVVRAGDVVTRDMMVKPEGSRAPVPAPAAARGPGE